MNSDCVTLEHEDLPEDVVFLLSDDDWDKPKHWKEVVYGGKFAWGFLIDKEDRAEFDRVTQAIIQNSPAEEVRESLARYAGDVDHVYDAVNIIDGPHTGYWLRYEKNHHYFLLPEYYVRSISESLAAKQDRRAAIIEALKDEPKSLFISAGQFDPEVMVNEPEFLHLKRRVIEAIPDINEHALLIELTQICQEKWEQNELEHGRMV